MRLGQCEHVRPADNDVEQFGRLKEVDVTGELGNARLACTPSQRSTQCVMARVPSMTPKRKNPRRAGGLKIRTSCIPIVSYLLLKYQYKKPKNRTPFHMKPNMATPVRANIRNTRAAKPSMAGTKTIKPRVKRKIPSRARGPAS